MGWEPTTGRLAAAALVGVVVVAASAASAGNGVISGARAVDERVVAAASAESEPIWSWDADATRVAPKAAPTGDRVVRAAPSPVAPSPDETPGVPPETSDMSDTSGTAVGPSARAEGPVQTAVTADAVARRISPPPRSVLVVLGGDVLNESAVNQAASDAAPPGVRYDFGPVFAPPVAPVADVLRGADLAVCHAELPIGAPGERPGVYGRSPFGGNLLLAPYELAGGLAAAGFDRCSTASNHSFDVGVPGIVSTLDALDAAGLSHVGTARSAEDAADDALLTANGLRIAHLSYTRSWNTAPPADPWMLERAGGAASAEAVAADVVAARAAGAELVIVSIHLGTEMQTGPTSGDRDFATRLTQLADIDLLIHHGPHVVQPVEIVNGTWVYWSLGNFVSGMGLAHQGRYADQRTLDGLLATVRFTEIEPGVFTAESRPVLVCTSRSDRSVHAPVGLLSDPVRTAALDPVRRAELQACVDRTRAVQPVLF